MKKISNVRPRLTTIATALLAAGTIQGCSSSEDSPPVDLFTLLAQGGNGGENGGAGGFGGSVSARLDGVGDSEYTNIGQTAVAFAPTAIAGIVTDLGSNALMVTGNTTVAVLNLGDARPAAGTPYLVTAGDTNMYLSTGTGNIPLTGETEDPVTGIDVAEGATLTLALNSFGGTEARFDVANDISNSGEITTEDVDATQRGSLRISGGRYIGTGMVTTYGTQDAQSGGSIDIRGDYAAYNSGDMLSYGAEGALPAATAGSGGDIDFSGGFYAENTGNFSSYGGIASGTGGFGGSGGDIQFDGQGNTGNSGTFDSHGGIGEDSGGDGGDINLNVDEFGELKNTGALKSYGGNASAGPGPAGDGGDVNLNAQNGGIWQNSSIMSYGGNSDDPAGSSGGDGGDVYIATDDQEFAGNADDQRTAGNLSVSGDIDTHGGNALATGPGNGGDAGSVTFDMDSHSQPQNRRTLLVSGYASFTTSGGDGDINGGDAGGVSNSVDSEDGDDDVEYAGGNVTNRVPVIARGGNVVAGAMSLNPVAGSGGSFGLDTPDQLGFVVQESMATLNTAALDLSAGTGSVDTMSGASGGSVFMWGYTSVQNLGAITSNGASDGGTNGGIDGYGGGGGTIDMATETGVASNSGELITNGGDGEFSAGSAGDVSIVGYAGATNSANITGNGGNADPALAGSFGGDGSYIWMLSGAAASATNAGTITNDRGVGETNGVGGALATNGTCTGDGC